MIYLFIIFAFLICIYLYDYKQISTNRNIVLKLLFITLTLLAGLRYRIGTDTISYADFYTTVPDIFSLKLSDFVNTRFAPLCFLLFSISKTICSDFVFFQLVISFIVNYTIFWFIQRYGRNRFVFTFLLMYFLTSYYMLNCEVLRESLAICVFIYSIPFLLDKKYIQYYLLCSVAILFHYGAVILLIFPLCMYIRVNKYFMVGIFVAYIFAFMMKDYFYLLNFVSVNTDMSNLINVYSESALNREFSLMNIVGISVNMILPLISCVYVKRNTDESFNLFEPFFALYLLMFVVSTSIWIFRRYSDNYLGIFELYYYSLFISCIVRKYSKIFISFTLVLLLLLPRFVYLYRYWTNDFAEIIYPGLKKVEVIIPYTNVLTNEKYIQRREDLYRVLNK